VGFVADMAKPSFSDFFCVVDFSPASSACPGL